MAVSMSRGGYARAVSATEGRVLPEVDAERGLTAAQVAERVARGLTNDLPAAILVIGPRSSSTTSSSWVPATRWWWTGS